MLRRWREVKKQNFTERITLAESDLWTMFFEMHSGVLY